MLSHQLPVLAMDAQGSRGGKRLALLQELDRNAVRRADEGHMAVARRPVDGDAGGHQPVAERVNVLHAHRRDGRNCVRRHSFFVPIPGQFDHRGFVAGAIFVFRGGEKNQGKTAFFVVGAPHFLAGPAWRNKNPAPAPGRRRAPSYADTAWPIALPLPGATFRERRNRANPRRHLLDCHNQLIGTGFFAASCDTKSVKGTMATLYQGGKIYCCSARIPDRRSGCGTGIHSTYLDFSPALRTPRSCCDVRNEAEASVANFVLRQHRRSLPKMLSRSIEFAFPLAKRDYHCFKKAQRALANGARLGRILSRSQVC